MTPPASLQRIDTALPLLEVSKFRRLNEDLWKQTPPKDSRHISLTRGMIFPDLHKVFFTARGILKVKVFKMDGEVVSWGTLEMPFTEWIVSIRKCWISSAFNDTTLPCHCSPTLGYKKGGIFYYSGLLFFFKKAHLKTLRCQVNMNWNSKNSEND